jgi:uncharacterized membrane protein
MKSYMARKRLKKDKDGALDRLTSSVSAWVGSWLFFDLHIVWFGLWLLFRLDINLLTLLVSLEAIILMLLLLMQQNRQVKKDDVRDEADYQADLRAMKITDKNYREIKKVQNDIAEIKQLLKHGPKKNS